MNKKSTFLLLSLLLLMTGGIVRAEELFLPAEIPTGMALPKEVLQRLYRPVRVNKALLDKAEPGQIVTLRLFSDTPLELQNETPTVIKPLFVCSWVNEVNVGRP